MRKKELEAKVKALASRLEDVDGSAGAEFKRLRSAMGKGFPQELMGDPPYRWVGRETITDVLTDVRELLNALIDHLGLEFKREPERLVLVQKAEKKTDE